ncbi:MAG: hypothetical protein Q8N52_07130 [Acidobacteriota bacterium]|nr:hypothetical protein [Acidobacteriota bacterium]
MQTCDATPDVRILTVYAFAMAKTVFVHVVNTPTPIPIVADRVEVEGAMLALYRGDKKVGEFAKGMVNGWYYGAD